MTPPPEFSQPRRSFVKKSLATSVSISFAGLIRAHGEEGGGTTTVPETTVMLTTAFDTTDGPTSPDTTVDPWVTEGPTCPETTVDPFETTVPDTTCFETTAEVTTTAPKEYKAAITAAEKIGTVDSKRFQIGADWYELTLIWAVVQPGYQGGGWNYTSYETAFVATLKKKMFNDSQNGPYTGTVATSASNSPQARSKTHRVDATCDDKTGSITCQQTCLEQDEHAPKTAVYLINNQSYRLFFAEYGIIGHDSGQGSSKMLTRSRAWAVLEGPDEQITFPSVGDTEIIVPGTEGPNGCYVISESYEVDE